MKRETLVIRPEKRKRRVGVLPTYSQRDRTKYTRKAKHRGQNGGTGEQHGNGWLSMLLLPLQLRGHLFR